jgi:hypothetical protein
MEGRKLEKLFKLQVNYDFHLFLVSLNKIKWHQHIENCLDYR